MALLNCRICGGSLEIIPGNSIAQCEYCGKEQTLPKCDDEQTINLLNRANHFRQIYEFDKAAELYEKILARNSEDSDIYWSLLLCKFGIEYVDDPLTKEKVPTCHRTHFKPIAEDPDYISAIEKADILQKAVYEKDAAYIDKVQKDILEISRAESPYDVFICYKETDSAGNRTPDSVLAQDIYYSLVEKGYKVFFSRITLEGKLGQQYEPCIFSALNTAKVMVVVGTTPEYFQAVWVKNEWRRFLNIMQDDRHKLIIPAYRDMDPYDLPDELSYFQAQDMSKIGFIQDLVRGIDKVLYQEEAKTEATLSTKTVVSSDGNSIALLKRGYLALEDHDWSQAASFFDQVLNFDAESADAYLGIFLSANNIENIEICVSTTMEKLRDTAPVTKVLAVDPGTILDICDEYSQFKLTPEHTAFGHYFTTIEYVEYYPSLVDRKNALYNSITSDKNMSKAIRFGLDAEKIAALNDNLLQQMDAYINEQQEADARILEDAKSQLEEQIQHCKSELSSFCELISNWEYYNDIKEKYTNFSAENNKKISLLSKNGVVTDVEKQIDSIDIQIISLNLEFQSTSAIYVKKRKSLKEEIDQLYEKKRALTPLIATQRNELIKITNAELAQLRNAKNPYESEYFALEDQYKHMNSVLKLNVTTM